MIKVPYSKDELEIIASEFYTDLLGSINIEHEIQIRPHDEITPLFTYLFNEGIERIIKDLPSALEARIPQLNTLVSQAKSSYNQANKNKTTRQVDKWFKREVLKIFNYDFNHSSFTKISEGTLAYRHAQRLNLSTCPYCNGQYTFTITNGQRKARPQFDHFFDKARHPYYALSFYNLIPSCSVCNSSLKNQRPFKDSTHLHPYTMGMEGLYRFRTNINSVDFLLGKKSFSVSIEKDPASDKNPWTQNNAIKAYRNIEDLAIKDRYAFHKDYAGEIIAKSYFYNNTTIKEFLESYSIQGKRLFSSEGEIIELLMGNYIHQDKLHKRILSKLTKDIAEEFGIKV